MGLGSLTKRAKSTAILSVDPIASRSDVALLLGRAAFGATKADLDRWTGQPYAAVVDHLLNVPDPATRLPAADDAVRLTTQYSVNAEMSQRWWLDRMATTAYPLEERMVLFWHDHFATAITEEVLPNYLMMQNQTLRLHALGHFRDLVTAITLDPAMLLWLDGNINVKAHPNENYARELFELFMLGVRPQVYTEHDIREAARALTGWTVNFAFMPEFNAANHDTGTKTVLGTTITDAGAEEYKAVLDAALAQPVVATFLAYKLVQNFVYDPPGRDQLAAPDPLVAEVASALAASGLDIKAGVRALLLSDRFRFPDETAGVQHVRQPIEVAVHAAKVLGVSMNTTFETPVLQYLDAAGQLPMKPPNVGGWPVGKAWFSQTAMKARYDMLWRIGELHNIKLSEVHNVPTAVLGDPYPPSADVSAGANAWAAFLGLSAFEPNTIDAMKSYLASVTGNELELQTGLFILAAMSPEWQVI